MTGYRGPAATGAEPMLSRRRMARSLLAAPLALLLAGRASGQTTQAACLDPEALSPSQKSRRTSLAFQIEGADPARTCQRCAFFAATSPTCGTCRLLGGGTVRPTSSCRSFAPESQS